MENNKATYGFLLILLSLTSAVIAWAVLRFPPNQPGVEMAVLAVITIAASRYLRFQLPKTKIQVTAGDALIFLAFLLHGPHFAVLLAVGEAAFTTLVARREGTRRQITKFAINVCIAALSVFGMTMTLRLVLGDNAIQAGALAANYLVLIGLMGISQFVFNTLLGLMFIKVSTGVSPWKINKQFFLNAIAMNIAGAFAGTLLWMGMGYVNYLLAAGAVLVLLVGGYRAYGRNAKDARKANIIKDTANRQRAETTHERIRELENHIAELERSGQEMRESREKFRFAAFHDKLTGLPNRERFVALITELITRDAADKTEFAVLFLDLNRFKTLNDSLGHSVGDRVIVRVAERLAELKGSGQVVGRFGGDEFGLLIPSFRSRSDVKRHAEKIARAMAQPFQLGNRQIFTSVSIGLAFCNGDYDTADELLRDADIAMYYAKEKLKPLEIFDPGMHAMAVDLLELETDLRSAIEREHFEVYYQPIVNLQIARLEGFEALVRWNHPSRGIISPNDFIPVAESTGLIIPITKQILKSACEQMVAWQRSNPDMEHATVSVNLSGMHFAVPGLVRQISDVIKKTGISPGSLRLEITESSVMTNAERAIEMLKGLRDLGVRISIDDFGTGYSSLSYLQRFPIDTLKVDRSFVSTMESGSENGEIVRTVIALAKVLGLSVVAEGIESIHQVHQLQILGCDYGQGYLFGRPLRVSDASRMVEDPSVWANILPVSGYRAMPPDLEYTEMELAN